MADTWYAWTDILLDPDEKTGRANKVKVGDKVSKADVGDTFNQHVESGAIRKTPYPDIPEGSDMSPVEHARKQLADMQADLMDEAEVAAAALAFDEDTAAAAEEADAAAEEKKEKK